MKDIEKDGVIYRICYSCRKEFELNSKNFYKNKTKNKGYETCCKNCSKYRLSKYNKNKSVEEKEIKNKYTSEWRKAQYKKGLCKVCNEPHLKDLKVCEKHWLQDMSRKHLGTVKRWTELKELFEKQNGVCAISGVKLEYGVNASIDHIKPLSKYPELNNDINNLQWVDKKINNMKLDMEIDEFLSFVKIIYKNNF